MKVFISWSGTRSKETAILLRWWLPNIVNDIQPWVSEEDIGSGGDWSAEITAELDKAEFGIICVTPGNMRRPWLLFEAGALSRQVKNEPSRVAPFLIGFASKSDLARPLGRFQSTQPKQADVLKLLRSLNGKCALRLTDRQLTDSFDVWWPIFEEKYQPIEGRQAAPRATRRDERDVLDEILQIVRSMQAETPSLSDAALRRRMDLSDMSMARHEEAKELIALLWAAGVGVEGVAWEDGRPVVHVDSLLPGPVAHEISQRFPFAKFKIAGGNDDPEGRI